MPHLVLGIDTSCDETSAAVIADGRDIRSNVVASQIEVHERFGGVVPELASRKHAEIVTRIVDRALRDAGVTLSDLCAIAVTDRPGLVGALLVGVAAAKAIAYVSGLPLIGVHHIEGHVYAPAMVDDVPFPHVCLTVSGGHTLLVRVDEGWRYEVLGLTLDDAVGEAYDKVAKLLGLGFPGGPLIDRLAASSDEPEVDFPRPMLDSGDFRFSFSGLKTAVRYHVERSGGEVSVPAVAAGFQRAAVETLVAKLFGAAEAVGARAVTITGGVAANRALRNRTREIADARGIALSIPPMSLCTDNGAMIAGVGYHQWRRGDVSGLQLGAAASGPLPTRTVA
ncbi:tRNA (adenosine(37)-N6)-threonylcarbamoyltransferase complex transferase subunit TsaD [Candidatus Poribacteria bacterium]|nr:tRNA (adenosine(37)-N6)-threonylcarbamoyltransferase complex transferase subunit TsaD [Candidatus Poribacteria bacterium]